MKMLQYGIRGSSGPDRPEASIRAGEMNRCAVGRHPLDPFQVRPAGSLHDRHAGSPRAASCPPCLRLPFLKPSPGGLSATARSRALPVAQPRPVLPVPHRDSNGADQTARRGDLPNPGERTRPPWRRRLPAHSPTALTGLTRTGSPGACACASVAAELPHSRPSFRNQFRPSAPRTGQTSIGLPHPAAPWLPAAIADGKAGMRVATRGNNAPILHCAASEATTATCGSGRRLRPAHPPKAGGPAWRAPGISPAADQTDG